MAVVRKKSPIKPMIPVNENPKSIHGSTTVPTIIENQLSKNTSQEASSPEGSPVTKEVNVLQSIKFDFSRALQRCSQVLFNAIPYIFGMLILFISTEIGFFFGRGTTEKLPELRYYADIAEYVLYILSMIGIIIHNIFDLLTQAKVDYDLYKKRGK